MNRDRINRLLNQIPTHVIILLTILIWVVPTLGLLVTSVRPPEAVRNTGWWTVFNAQTAGGPYVQYCAECHGADGTALPQADLTNPDATPGTGSLPEAGDHDATDSTSS